MNLTPPPEGELYSSLESLVAAINEHAGPEGYAVVIARTKNNKKGEKRKAWIRCDRGGKHKGPYGQKRIHGSSRLSECPLKITAKKIENEHHWMLTVEDPFHNHTPTLPGSHPALRKLALTEEVVDVIKRQSKVDIAPAKIISGLRLNTDEENPMLKRQDIYNAKTVIKRQILGAFTPVQALMQQLEREDWTYNYEKDGHDRITRLFFSKGSSEKTLKMNHEVLIMDCTYKTNRYKMPLLVITGQTALNTTFYVAFAFLGHENEEYYTWALIQLQLLYRKLGLLDPTAIITDCEPGLLPAMRNLWPTVSHLLCVWHINTNVLTQCRKKFDTEEAWEKFNNAWKEVVYASSLEEFESAWDFMNDNYNESHTEQMEYLNNTYIRFHKKKFVTYWTNKTLNFFTTTSSRGESGHALLKRNLNISTGKMNRDFT